MSNIHVCQQEQARMGQNPEQIDEKQQRHDTIAKMGDDL